MKIRHAAALVIAAIGFFALLPRPAADDPEPLASVEEQTAETVTEEPYIPDRAEVDALARMVYGEARGVASTTEKAACIWCVLNRVDDPRFPDNVIEVVTAPYQFQGYSPDNPINENLAELAADVLTRYHAERDGSTNTGRVLPADYCFFTGDGKHNYFTVEYLGADYYKWTLESPYDD